jgi:hypothetical protein
MGQNREQLARARCLDAAALQLARARCLDAAALQLARAQCLDAAALQLARAQCLDAAALQLARAQCLDAAALQLARARCLDAAALPARFRRHLDSMLCCDKSVSHAMLLQNYHTCDGPEPLKDAECCCPHNYKDLRTWHSWRASNGFNFRWRASEIDIGP